MILFFNFLLSNTLQQKLEIAKKVHHINPIRVKL